MFAFVKQLTSGLPSILYGSLRPICWLIVALVAYKAPYARHSGRWAMVAGALGLATASVVFVFVNAGTMPPPALVGYAAIVSTPATVVFVFGFAKAAIRIAGLEFGEVDDG